MMLTLNNSMTYIQFPVTSCSIHLSITSRLLKFKARLTNAIFATINQMFSGSSQLLTMLSELQRKNNLKSAHVIERCSKEHDKTFKLFSCHFQLIDLLSVGCRIYNKQKNAYCDNKNYDVKCESVKMISQIVLDLHGVIVDLKGVGLFGYEQKRLS